MGSGGSRNRSGPAPDPNSGRSDRRGFSLTALPNEGYQGEAPHFPLVGLGEGGQEVAQRERVIWESAWTTPQAAAWARESWRWPIVAEYCRLKAIVELNAGANAALTRSASRRPDSRTMAGRLLLPTLSLPLRL